MGGVPTAVSRLGEGDSREAQNLRAVKWLLAQNGGPMVVVTPRRSVESECLARLTSHPRVRHHAWRGQSGGFYDGQRVLYAWPDRQRLNEIWNVNADAIAVIEWSTEETTEWIEDVNAVQLYPGRTVEPTHGYQAALDQLPNGLDAILEHVAAMAAGYSSGLEWNEEDQLKADMMNRPDRWADVTVAQVRATCRQLRMRGKDVGTIADFVQQRNDGRRYNVRSSYRTFKFN